MPTYVKSNDALQKWNRNVFFPKDSYNFRIVEATFGISNSSKNPMVTVEMELYGAEPVVVGDDRYDVNGQKTRKYFVLDVKDEPVKTANNQNNFDKFLRSIGFEGDWDTTNPPVDFIKGKCIAASAYGDEQIERKTPTKEQKEKGEPGTPIINPVTRKEAITYQIAIQSIYGLSNVENTAAF